jgi:hypothetical protein
MEPEGCLPAPAAATATTAATHATATAATTAAAGTAATTAAATAATGTFLRLIDAQGTAAHVFSVQCLNRTVASGAFHLHEAEAAWAAGFAIIDQRYRLDSTVLLEQRANLSLIRRKREVSYIDLHIERISLKNASSANFDPQPRIEDCNQRPGLRSGSVPMSVHISKR